MTLHPLIAKNLGAAQRVLALALFLPSLLLITIAALPALAVLPFRDKDAGRALKLLAAHTTHTQTLLEASRPAHQTKQPHSTAAVPHASERPMRRGRPRAAAAGCPQRRGAPRRRRGSAPPSGPNRGTQG